MREHHEDPNRLHGWRVTAVERNGTVWSRVFSFLDSNIGANAYAKLLRKYDKFTSVEVSKLGA
jgi:hypothetical protein